MMKFQKEWIESAKEMSTLLYSLMGDTVVDIQHIGSTSIPSIHAKPIIDLAVGVHELDDVLPSIDILEKNGIVFRGQDVQDQLLFVAGDFGQDTRTHHIHVVKMGSEAWCNYLNFRDYLNTHPDKAGLYDALKLELAEKFPDDRKAYTAGKKAMVDRLLKEAHDWRIKSEEESNGVHSFDPNHAEN